AGPPLSRRPDRRLWRLLRAGHRRLQRRSEAGAGVAQPEPRPAHGQRGRDRLGGEHPALGDAQLRAARAREPAGLPCPPRRDADRPLDRAGSEAVVGIVFVIEDERHAEPQGEFASLDAAVAELHRRAALPWDEEPNVAPCTGWRTCGRTYEVIEYDNSARPWKELRRIP